MDEVWWVTLVFEKAQERSRFLRSPEPYCSRPIPTNCCGVFAVVVLYLIVAVLCFRGLLKMH